MFVFKNFNLNRIWRISGVHMIWLVLWGTLVVLIYEYTSLKWLVVPWLPLSVIGTAVAFYLGFKNNSSYDRLWEARKIWGAIVNSSRAWGTYVKSFVSNQFTDVPVSEEELYEIKKKLIYHHIGWLYALREQLLVITPWEHAAQTGYIGNSVKKNRKLFGVGLINEELKQVELKRFLSPEIYERLINCKNTATQIIDQQSVDLAELRKKGIINDFRHIELQQILYHFYEHQGKCERIKKYPFPRQYAGMSLIFVGIFIFLLPFGMVSEFAKLGSWGTWLSIPFTALVGWVYLMMELVGDYSENPFQGLGNDIPMLSLCRVIEIDLREMLGEKELPENIEAKKGVLM